MCQGMERVSLEIFVHERYNKMEEEAMILFLIFQPDLKVEFKLYPEKDTFWAKEEIRYILKIENPSDEEWLLTGQSYGYGYTILDEKGERVKSRLYIGYEGGDVRLPSGKKRVFLRLLNPSTFSPGKYRVFYVLEFYKKKEKEKKYVVNMDTIEFYVIEPPSEVLEAYKKVLHAHGEELKNAAMEFLEKYGDTPYAPWVLEDYINWYVKRYGTEEEYYQEIERLFELYPHSYPALFEVVWLPPDRVAEIRKRHPEMEELLEWAERVSRNISKRMEKEKERKRKALERLEKLRR